jgi:hypothetical protein
MLGRWGLLAVLSAGCGTLLWRKRITPKPVETCINGGVCRGCQLFETCGLPVALSMKKATGHS